jgi:hypothetical protein
VSLPTVEQAQEFLALVNKGRTAAGLEPLEKLDFDGAEPMIPTGCLSALNLFRPIGVQGVWKRDLSVEARNAYRAEGPLKAIGCELSPGHSLPATGFGAVSYWSIPDAILAVTNPFDSEEPGLRERLEDAGVV